MVRRTERALATAPLVSLSQRAPLELEPFGLPPPASGAPLGYLSLALGIRHLEGPGRLAKAVGLLGSYRSYILCVPHRLRAPARAAQGAAYDAGCCDGRARCLLGCCCCRILCRSSDTPRTRSRTRVFPPGHCPSVSRALPLRRPDSAPPSPGLLLPSATTSSAQSPRCTRACARESTPGCRYAPAPLARQAAANRSVRRVGERRPNYAI